MLIHNTLETRAAIRRAVDFLDQQDPEALFELALNIGDVGVFQVAHRPLDEEEQSGGIFSTTICTRTEHGFLCDANCEAR